MFRNTEEDEFDSQNLLDRLDQLEQQLKNDQLVNFNINDTNPHHQFNTKARHFNQNLHNSEQICQNELNKTSFEFDNLTNAINTINNRLDYMEQNANNQNPLIKELIDFNEQYSSNITKFNHDIRCLKYEMKQIKEKNCLISDQIDRNVSLCNQNLNSYQDNNQSIINDLKEQLTQDEITYNEQIQCTNSRIDQIQAQNDCETFKRAMKCFKHEIKRTNSLYLNLNTEFEKLRNDNINLYQVLKCMKYEIKQLKQLNSNTQQYYSQIINSNNQHEKEIEQLRNENNSLRHQFQEMNDKQSEFQKNNDQLINYFKESMKCVKYEIKKIKKQESENSLSKLETQIRQNNMTTLQNEVAQLKTTIKCIKHEIKEIKSKQIIQSNEQSIKAIENSNDSILHQIESIENKFNCFEQNIKCVKHELKKLKEINKQKSFTENEMTLQNEVVKNEIESIKNQLRTSSELVKLDLNQAKQQNESIENNYIQFKEIIRCLKYEIRKIKTDVNFKSNINELEIVKNELALIQTNLNKQEAEINEIKPLPKDFNERIECLNNTNHQMKSCIQCIKHEIKQIKEHSKNSNQEFKKDITTLNEFVNSHTVESNETSEILKNHENQLQEVLNDSKQFKSSIKCIKHELKRMKTTVEQHQEYDRKEFIEEDLKTIQDQLKSEDVQLNEFSETLQKKETAIEGLINDYQQVKSVIQCLKHEMKQLKENHEKDQQDRATKEDINIIKTLLTSKTVESNEEIQLKSTIRCIKHELKLLKENTTKSQQEFIRKQNLDDLANEINTLKEFAHLHQNESNELKNAIRSHSEQIKEIEDENKRFKLSTQCIKHELKRIKGNTENGIKDIEILKNELESIRNTNTQQISNSLDDFNTNFTHLTEQFDMIKSENCQLNYAIRCIKYEVKKLKERIPTIESQISKRIDDTNITIQSDLEQLKAETNSKQQHLNIEEDNDQMKQSIQCLKHELRKLKNEIHKELDQSNPKEDNKIHLTTRGIPILDEPPVFPEEMNARIDLIENDNHQMKSCLQCIKHELKQLKANNNYKHEFIKKPDLADLTNDINTMKEFVKSHQNESNELKNAIQSHSKQIKEIEDENKQFKSSIQCIKHELKQIKGNTEKDFDTLNKDITTLNEFVNSHKVESNETTETLKNHENQIQEILNDSKQFKSSIKCIKHELKQIKGNTGKDFDSLNKDITTLNEFVNSHKVESNETTETLKNQIQEILNDSKQFKSSIKCIKHELKQMKSTVEQHQEYDRKEFIEEDLKTIQDQLKSEEVQLNEFSETLQKKETAIEGLINDYQQVKSVIQCLKHEIKQLKENHEKDQQERANILQTEVTSIKDNLSSLQQSNKSLHSNTQEQFDRIKSENCQLNDTLRCIKYEVKKLKERIPTIESQISKRIDDTNITIQSDLEQLKAETNSKQHHLNIEEDNDRMKQSIQCLKHELRKLKSELTLKNEIHNELDQSNPNEDNRMINLTTRDIPILDDPPVFPEEMNARIDLIENDNHQMKSCLQCIKHELKQMKEHLRHQQEEKNQLIANQMNDIKSIEDTLNTQQIEPIQLTDPNQSKEDIELLVKDFQQVKSTLQCLKHEMKQLKANNNNKHEFIKKPDLADLTNDINTIKEFVKSHQNESNELKNAIQSHSKQIKEIEDENKQFKSSIKCIKHELKQIKGNTEKNFDTLNKDITTLNEFVNSHKVEANETTETLKNHENQLQHILNDSNQFKSSIQCLKHELKRIKGNTENEIKDIEILKNELESIRNNLNTQQISNSIDDFNTNFTHLTEQFDMIKSENCQLNYALRCIKYEAKKLKERIPTIESQISKRIDDTNVTIQSDLEQLKAETNSKQHHLNIEEDNQRMKQSIQCLKHELRKLKNEIHNELDQSNPNEDNRMINLTTRDIPILDDPPVFPEEMNARIDLIENDNHQMKSCLQCIKHELKQMKEHLRHQQEEKNQLIANQMNDIKSKEDTLNTQQIEPKQLIETNQSKEEIELLVTDFQQVKSTLQCLKHELKQLKANTQNDQEAATKEDVKTIKGLSHSKRFELNEEILNDHKQMKSAIQCIKHELKRMKENNKNESSSEFEVMKNDINAIKAFLNSNKAESNETSPITTINQDQIDLIPNENKQLKSTIQCIKHELKQLKENIKNASILSIQNEIDSIKNDLNTIRDSLPISLSQGSISEPNISLNPKSDLSQLKLIRDQNIKMKHDISCMKFELKKLKNCYSNNPILFIQNQILDTGNKISEIMNTLRDIQSVTKTLENDVQSLKDVKEINLDVRSVSLPSIPIVNDINRLDAFEQKLLNHQLELKCIKNEHFKFKHDQHCIKHEMKKLKNISATNSSINLNEISPLNSDMISSTQMNDIQTQLSSFDKEIQSMKSSIELIEETMQNLAKHQDFVGNDDSSNEIERIKTELLRFKRDQRCIKHELKALKETTSETLQLSFDIEPQSYGEFNLFNHTQRAQNKANTASKIAKEAKDQTFELKRKYERLKDENLQFKQEIESLKNDFSKSNPLFFLSDAYNNDRAASQQVIQFQESLDSFIGSQPISMHKSTPVLPKAEFIDSNRIDSIENNLNRNNCTLKSIKDEHYKFKHDNHCMKHELKKIKNQLENSELPPKSNIDLIDQIQKLNDKMILLKNENSFLRQSIHCIKHELKLIKIHENYSNEIKNQPVNSLMNDNQNSKAFSNQPISSIDNKEQISSLFNEYQDSTSDQVDSGIDKEQNSNEIKDKNSDLLNNKGNDSNEIQNHLFKDKYNDSETETYSKDDNIPKQYFIKELDPIRNDIKCLKYEIKKLKTSSKPLSTTNKQTIVEELRIEELRIKSSDLKNSILGQSLSQQIQNLAVQTQNTNESPQEVQPPNKSIKRRHHKKSPNNTKDQT